MPAKKSADTNFAAVKEDFKNFPNDAGNARKGRTNHMVIGMIEVRLNKSLNHRDIIVTTIITGFIKQDDYG